MDNIISKAITNSGGPQSLADKLGVSIQRVVNWRNRGRIPPEWVVPVSRESGIDPHDLSPNVFKEKNTAA